MKSKSGREKLLLKVKVVFGKRYNRDVSDQEAIEIMANLTEFMEILFKKRYAKPIYGDG